MIRKIRKRAPIALLLCLATSSCLVLLLHCSVDDEPLGTKKSAPSADDAQIDGAASADGAGVVPGLCERVGGPQQVAAVSDAIFEAAAADCRVGAYFTAMPAESATHVKECMRRQLAEMFQCADSTYAGFKSSVGRECRNMATAHAALVGADGRPGLNAVDALAYNQAAQGAMKAKGLSDSDTTRVLALFNALSSAITTRPSSPTDRNTSCTCAGGAFNGEPCIPDGGYVLVDAGRDGSTADTGPKDTGGAETAPDTGPADAGGG